MKTIHSSRLTSPRRAPRLGRVTACAALGLMGLFAPSTQAQTNSNGCFAAPAGLVGWWRAEDDAADFTGANSGSFPFGAAFTNGVVGQAFDFDGSSRRVSIPDSPALQLTNAMTLEAWVYPRAYGGFITFRGDNRGGLDNWTLDTYDTGFVKFSLIDPTNNAVSLRAPLALNQWQHVAATWSRASGVLRIYINGTLSAQTNSPLVPIGALDPASEPAIGIGNHGGTFHQFPFNGLIDELGIYNRALNSNEIAGIVAAGSAGKCTSSTPPVASPWLLSVDFGADVNGNDKAGFAALGQTTNDVWNFYSRDDGAGGWRTFGVLSNLKTVGGTVTPAGLTVANAPGAWGNGSPDKMYDDYIYPFNGGNVTVTVTNLPAGQYDVLAYANDGNFELAVGGYTYGTRTSLDVAPTNSPVVWTAGVQYARYTNVSVTAGVPLVLTVRPGIYGYAIISGLQLSAALTTNTVPGTNPPAGDCVALPNGAISWWRGEGSTLDSIRTNNGTVVGGVTTVPGKVGNGFGFDGTGYLVVPHHPSLNNSNALTLELWYKSTQNTNSDYGLIDKRVGFTGANFGINVIAGAGLGAYYDDLTVQDGDDIGSSFETSRYNPIPAPGVFHHLAATYVQFSNNLVRVQTYLNGQNVRTRYIAGNLANTINSTPVTIGATAQGAGEFFQGVIDEVTLYNRVLSATEIQSIYAADTAGKCGTPITNPPPEMACYDARETFTTNSNPTGVWSYGVLPAFGGDFGLNPEAGNWGGLNFWRTNLWLGVPGVYHNPSSQTITNPTGTMVLAPGQLAFHPGPNGEFAVIRFTAPGNDYYQITASFAGADIQGTTTDVHLLLNGSPQRSGAVNGFGPGSSLNISTNLYLPAGAHLDFAVGRGANNEFSFDSTAVAIQICTTSNTGPVTPLAITQHPQDTLVIAGGTAQFEVVASGFPTPIYQWYFQNNPLPGQTSATLILDNVLPDKQGTYSVHVSNPGGALFSSNATLTVVTTQAVVLVNGTTSGFYNEALGTILDGTVPQFPLPFGQGDDPTFFPADEPNLAAATNILGHWLATPPALNSNWQAVAVIPDTWALNTETAIIYPVDAGNYGIADLRGDFDADNGIYVWVNGQFKFGARAPGLPSPTGVFEYTNVFLGSLPPGTNYIQILREDSGITAGAQIRLTGTAMSTNRQPPTIVQSPTNQTVAAGSSALFTVAAEGTPELSYQWRFEGADLAGQTSRTLSLLNVQPARAGNYSVLVSNPYGSVTSTVVTLTVLTYPPTITSQPQDRTGYEGQSVSFTVGATGTATLRYQWLRNGTNLPNAIMPTLTVPNLQSNLTGLYQVIVSNPYGTATSRLAQLTLLPPPPCTPAPDGIIASWPGQSNLWDVVGGFDATPYQTLPYSLYTTGKVGATLNLGANQNYAIVRTGGGLNVNAGSGLTIEGWVRPNSLSGAGPIAEWSDGRSAVGAGLLLNSGGLGTIEATLTDTNLPRVTVTFRSTALAITNGLWQHVALTYNKSNGLATIYVSGNVVAQTNAGSLTPTTSGDVYLGYRAAGTYAGTRFNGTLDEITLYNRALAAEEVQSIVAADFIGKCPPLPPACVTPPADIVAWWRGESNTVDVVAGNDAIRIPTNYSATLAYQTGQVGMAFRFNLQNTLSVPRSESLDVGTGNGLTVEGWIYPATLSPMPIVEWTDTNSYGANLWLSYSRGATVLEANLIDTGGGFHLIRSPINTIRGYSWQHVAVTYDKTTGIAALYSDGALVVSTNLGFFTPRTSTDLLIGSHPRSTTGGGDGAPPTSDYRFNGAMDELAIYRRALTAGEIRTVARPRPGKCLELPPTLSQHPQPQISIAGGTAQFTVKVGGTAPFQYQWLFAGQPIDGVTNASLSLNQLDLADAGLYSVRISNLFGAATSRAAELTVLPANQCLPTPYGAVAFWRGESNVVDELGRHPAQWGSNTLPVYASGLKDGGIVGTAFRFNGANHLQIPSDADLNVGAGGGFTVEGWVKPDSLFINSQPIWDWSDSKGNIGVGLMLGRTGPGVLEVTLTDTNALNTIERIVTLTTPTYTIGNPTNSLSRWFHIALTYDKVGRKLSLYVDGRMIAERSVPMLLPYNSQNYTYQLFNPATTGNLYFGWRPFGSGAGARFRGAMDEMSVYYRALTPLELQALYLVGANGKCSPAPTCQTFNPSIVSWWRGESNVLDSVDGNHGFSSPAAGPAISYTNGIVGSGFKTSSSRYVQIPASPSLNVGTSTGLTFETWFKLDSGNTAFALASWNLGSTQGVYIGTSPTRGAGYLEANLVDTSGISRVISLFIHSSVVSGVQPWQHLAVTYDKPSGQAILYLNGSPVVVTNLGSFTPRTTGGLNLGFRPQTSIAGASLTGTLDETTLYNRALTADEITANYRNVANRCMEPPVIVQAPQSVRVNSGSNVTFTVVATGSPLLRYQWGKLNGPITLSPLLGQTNITLSLTNVQAKDAGSYWIRVTNAFGSATSSNIQLVVNVRPTALSQTVTTEEDSPRSFTLLASDANQDLLVYTVLTQPTNGTLVATSSNLVYTPLPNFFGADSLTFKVNDGLLDSLPATVSILVTPVNDPPTAGSQIVSTNEDTPLPLTLAAADADGNVLTFQITPPAHGMLSGIAPNLVYTPHANYFGDDLFTYTVKDGSNAVSELAAISITVRPINDTPVARMELAPLDELPGITNLVSIAPVCCAATLRLDASQSSDVENEPLSYAWLIGTNVVSTEAISTNRLAPGTYEITLIVSDGTTAAHQTRTVEILTATETVDYLTQLVEAGVNSRSTRSPLLNWLRETGKSFDRCHVEQGVHFLELFRDRVADRIKPTDPELAQSLMDTATAIIEAAPDCDPCQRLGRKDRKHGRDHDRDERDGRNGRDRHDGRDNDRNDRNRSDDRNSDERGRDERESKSERAAAPAAQSSQAELRPVAIETGAERTAKARE